ncbi:MAG: hypothetical protein ACLPIC_09965 [Rhodoblastus sp.]|uniref:hypothetical protein n=1 Tax=Rhodoblastus sp. TaxID=1962975 RepID=UPI003F98AE1C
MPTDLAPKSAAHYYFVLWDWEGKLDRGHKAPYVAAREAAGREEASPTAAIIDRQSAKAAQKGGAASTPRALMRAGK